MIVIKNCTLRWLVPFLTVGAVTFLRESFDWWLGDEIPYGSFFLAIAVSGLFGGFFPSMFSILLSAVSACWFFIEPRYSFFPKDQHETAGLIFFMAIGLVISAMAHYIWKGKNAAAERDLAEARLRRAEEIAHLGSWELDLVRNKLTWSDEVYRIFGLVPKEFGASYEAFLNLVHPEDRAAVEEAYSSSLRENRDSYQIEHRIFRRGTGEVRYVHEKCQHVRDREGRVTASIGMVHDITERRLAEERLRDLADQRRLSLEASELGIWEYNLKSGQVALDERCGRIWGVDADRVICFEDLMVHVHPQDRNQLLEAVKVASVAKGETVHETEFRVIWRDGSIHWVSAHGKIDRKRDGEEDESSRLIGVASDITEKKLTQGAIARSEERFRRLIEVSSEIVWVTDARGVPEEDSPSWRAFTGWDREEWLNRNWLTAVHPDEREKLSDEWREALATKGIYSPRFRMRHKSGEYRHVECRAAPILNPDGSIREWIGMISDITEQKIAEEALKESRKRLRVTFDKAGVGIVEVEGDDQFVAVNDNACEILGYSRHELLAMNVHELTYTDDRPLSDAVNAAIHRGVYDRFGYEKRYIRKDGAAIWAHVTVSAIRDDQNRWIRSITTIEDISERKRAEQALELAMTELKEADRRKNEFMAMLAHELRNPMSTISAAAALLKRMKLPTEASDIGEAMQRQVRQLAKMVDDLLDISRIIQGKVVLDRQRFDLRESLDQALGAARATLEASSHRITVNTGAEPLCTFGDQFRLQQVFTNLFSNAVRYSESNGEITVGAKRAGGTVTISFKDSGIGIPAEYQDKIFEPFVQITPGIARSRGGLGIGLAIVKQLVELHGGKVGVYSEGSGKGTTFTVVLPLQESVSAPVEKAPGEVHPGLSILVVDDNRDTADLTAALLKEAGHHVTKGYDGEAGLALALDQVPDVVLLDIGLPGMDGYEVARSIRCAGNRGTLLVAVTGYGEEKDRRKSHEIGFDGHLLKPLQFEVLLGMLSTWQRSERPKWVQSMRSERPAPDKDRPLYLN